MGVVSPRIGASFASDSVGGGSVLGGGTSAAVSATVGASSFAKSAAAKSSFAKSGPVGASFLVSDASLYSGAEYTGVESDSVHPPATANPMPTVAGMIMLRMRALRNRNTRIRICCSLISRPPNGLP